MDSAQVSITNLDETHEMLLQENQRHYDEIQCNSRKTIISFKQQLQEVGMKTCNIPKV